MCTDLERTRAALAPIRARSSITPTLSTALTKVDSQRASINLLASQELLGGNGALDIDEVGVGEAARLASAAIDGDADVHDVADLAEQLVEVAVRHLEG